MSWTELLLTIDVQAFPVEGVGTQSCNFACLTAKIMVHPPFVQDWNGGDIPIGTK